MAANETRIFQTMKEASPLIYATFLDIATKKLLQEQDISSRILNASNPEFLAWLKSAVSLEELNQAILERNTLPEGITQPDYIAFANRPDRDKIVNYLFNDSVKRETLQAQGQATKEALGGIIVAMGIDLKLNFESAQKIIALCSSGNISYIAPISDQQYQEWLDNNIKPTISTVKNDIYYLAAQKEIDILAKDIDPSFPVVELKKGIAKIIRVIELATYNLAPSLWNKDIQFVAGNVSKTNTLPPLLYEYYSMLTALHRNELAPEEFILMFNQKVSPFLGKLLQQKREEENSLFSKYNLSNHYTWHLRGLDFLLTIPKLAHKASALSKKRKSVILSDEKEAELASDLSVGEEEQFDEEKFLEKLISHLMDTRSLSRDVAEKRVRQALAESGFEEAQRESTSIGDGALSSSSSAPPPPAPPLPPAARVRSRAANTLKLALGKDGGDPQELDKLVNTMISRGVSKTDIQTARTQMEKKKEAAPKAQSIPAATKYGPLEIAKVQEPAIVHIFSHLPSEEKLAQLKSGYLLVKDAKLVKTRLYYVSPKGLVECRSDANALESLCTYLDQTLDKEPLLTQLSTFFMAAPFNLSAEDATKRATTVLEETEKENAPIEGSLSSSLPSAAPLSSEAEFKLKLKNSLRNNIENDAKDSKIALGLVDTFMATAGLKCVTLEAKQHQELILKKCGGHNYKAAESAASMSVAASRSSSTQGPMVAPAPMGSIERRPSLGVSQGAPAPIGSVERKPSLGFSQGAPAKKYNFEGYEVSLLKEGENLPEDVAIQEKMLYAKWDSNTKELTVKFKQGEAAPISFSMNISMSDRIKLLTGALENPDNTDWEKVNGFIKSRTENPDIGQRSSVAFRKPPQLLEPKEPRSVSPEKAKESAEDGSKEKGKEDAAEKTGIVSVSPLSFLPPVEKKKESASDSPKDTRRLSASPKASFLPPPVTEEKEGPTPPDDTQNKASGTGLNKGQ